MGYLHYSNATSFSFEDRILAHLRTVILSKLNLQESLIFTWIDDGRQHSIWLHPSMPLHFEFESETSPKLDPAWLEELVLLANSPGGLRIALSPPSAAP